MHYVLDALKVNIKLMSPCNRYSLKTERYIQTINNLIIKHHQNKGTEWPSYVTSCCFVSTTTGFISYELVFLKNPPDILNLHFSPLKQIATGNRDYGQKMRPRLDNISNVTFQEQRQIQDQIDKQVSKPS